MTILLVDDQRSILEGLLSGVPFRTLGFDQVLTACDAREAWELIRSRKVDVLLTDIEMPGENGLQLIEKVRADDPDMLCIPLTSHADFEFAKASVRLGCFDYLVQPAPYADIAACLKKAYDRRVQMAQESHARSLGSMFQVNEPSLTAHMVMRLYSPNAPEVEEALKYLNACGYVIMPDTPVRLCAVMDLPYARRDDLSVSRNDILAAIRDSFLLAPGHPVPLITRNPYRVFMVLLCHPDGVSHVPCTKEPFSFVLEEITRRLKREPAVFVRPETRMDRIQAELPVIQRFIDDNVTERTGVFYTDQAASSVHPLTHAMDFLPRWKSLLDQDKYDILAREIEASLDRSQQSRPDLRVLADLHQQWTQAVFEHLTAKGVDIMGLFTPEYTYPMYMDCFKTLQNLKKGMLFLLEAASDQQHISLQKSDVERAKAYIHSHLSQPILVTEVAEHINLSSEYFTRLFKKETGQNIKDYILQAKIDAARELLVRSEIPVSMIALEMGYDNFSHFTQIFKKICGLTPSEYRKQYRENSR